jgi:hypothetical protein
MYLTLLFVFSKIRIGESNLLLHTNDFYHLKGGETYKKFNDFDHQKQYDIIFLGSSRAYRGYDPALFEKQNLTCWNLGTSAQILRNTRIVMNHYVHSTNCKMVIIDIFPAALNTPGLESSSDLITNLSLDAAAREVALNMKDSRMINLWLNRWMSNSVSVTLPPEDYKGAGFSTRFDSMPEETLAYDAENNQKELQISDDQLQELKLIAQLAKDKKVPLLFVISPTSTKFSTKIYQSFLAYIRPILNENNVPLWDYAKNLEVNTPEHFYDDSHMNYYGVQVFNQRLIEDLKKSDFTQFIFE